MIVIYGAGNYGQRMYNFLYKLGVNIDCFCQTEVDDIPIKKRQVLGIPLISSYELFHMEGEHTVFLAVFNKKEREQIKKRIYIDSEYPIEIFDCSQFISDNLFNIHKSLQSIEVYDWEIAKLHTWKKYFENEKKFKIEYENLIRKVDNSKEVELIINRLKILYRDQRSELSYTSDEKEMIYRIESDFMQNIEIGVDDSGELVRTWKQYTLYAKYSFDPSIFYYHLGIDRLEQLERVCKKNIIDAGAYIGDSSIVLSHYTECEVYAFEAYEKNFKMIEKICELNHIFNVKPINRAISDCTCFEKMYISESDSTHGFIERNGVKYKGEMNVQCTSIDAFVSENSLKVGLIKSDIEGGELKLLKGAQKTIKEQRPVLVISIYHSADDFFNIKKYIESLVPEYKFSIFRPYVKGKIIGDTMLLCE